MSQDGRFWVAVWSIAGATVCAFLLIACVAGTINSRDYYKAQSEFTKLGGTWIPVGSSNAICLKRPL